MDTALFAVFAAAYAALALWLVLLARRSGWSTPSNLLLLVVLALVYDNTVLAAGSAVGEGPLLEGLNRARYWLHGLITPWLVVVGWDIARRAGVRWVRATPVAVAAVALAAALVGYELLTQLVGLRVEARREYGVLSYTDAQGSDGPPLMVLVVAAVLIACGVAAWRASGWPWAAVGALLMTAGSAVPVPVDSAAVTNAFELALLTSLVLTKHHQDGHRGSGGR